MQYVHFGQTGMKVSRLALGAMSFSRELDEEASRRVLAEAIDHGVNLVDTADAYAESESFLGRILGDRRKDVFLVTKVFRRYAAGGRVTTNSRINILHNIEQSLRNLNVDYIDLYLLHHPDHETPLGETLTTLNDLIRAGKVRYVGVCNHYAWQMAYMVSQAEQRGFDPVVSYQGRYNIFDRQIEVETVPFLQRFQLATMIYGPLCGGVLSGKYSPDQPPPPGTRGATNKKVKRYINDRQLHEVLGEIETLADEQGLSLPQVAILWLMAKPYVNTILLGGSRPEHFTHQYEIADRQLPTDVVERIDELSESWRYGPYFNQARIFGARLPYQPPTPADLATIG